MSIKRRDKRNRILRDRESQMPDGRYRYTYYVNGEQKSFYSWKLEPTDKLPQGKRDCISLREKIEQLRADERNGLVKDRRKMTVYDLCVQYTGTKETSVTPNTVAGYKTVLNHVKNNSFGSLTLDKVNDLKARSFLSNLQKNGMGYSSIQSIKGVLKPAFAVAVRNNLVIRNYFDFPLCEVIVNDSKHREAVCDSDKTTFLSWVAENKHYRNYLDRFIILFETGMRVSELCGLTFSDIHLDENGENYVRITHQLQKHRDGHLYVKQHGNKATGKAEYSLRDIPLSQEAIEAFKRVYASRPKLEKEFVVDGYTGFVFINTNKGICRPVVAYDIEHHLKHAIDRFNSTHEEKIAPFTPHCCRHTFCTDLVNTHMDIKSVQYVMGHGDIATTLGIYAHSNRDNAFSEFHRVKGRKE